MSNLYDRKKRKGSRPVGYMIWYVTGLKQHTHVYHQRKKGQTLLLNPGEIMCREGRPGFCLLETETGDIRQVLLNL